MTSVDPSWPLYIIFHTCFRIVLTTSSCSEILLNCNQQWKKSVFTPWQTITDILLVLKFFNFNALQIFSYFRIFETLPLARLAYKVLDRKSRGYRPIMIQFYRKKTNKSSVFESHVTGHTLATCPCAEFFINVVFENIIIRKPIHSLLFLKPSWKYS